MCRWNCWSKACTFVEFLVIYIWFRKEQTRERKKKGPSVVERYMPDKILTPETFKMAEE